MADKDETNAESSAEKAYAAAASEVPVPAKAPVEKAAPVTDVKAEAPVPVVAKVAPVKPPVAAPAAAKPVEVKATEAKPVAVETAMPTAKKVAPAKAAVAKPAAAKPPFAAKPVVRAAKPVAAKAPVSKPAASPKALAKPLPAQTPAKSAASATKAAQAKPVAKTVKNSVAPQATPAMPVVAAKATETEFTAPSIAPAKPVPVSKPIPSFTGKDSFMDMSANFGGFQDAITEAQAKAKAAFEKSTTLLGEYGEFAKGNVEAVIESGKIFAEGVQGMGSTLVAEGRSSFETMSADVKELAAAKSPTDFMKLQGDLVRKNFDSVVAYNSKNSEAMLKLMSDVFAPISGRVSLAVEKVRQTAA